jgi:hypothetical protein
LRMILFSSKATSPPPPHSPPPSPRPTIYLLLRIFVFVLLFYSYLFWLVPSLISVFFSWLLSQVLRFILSIVTITCPLFLSLKIKFCFFFVHFIFVHSAKSHESVSPQPQSIPLRPLRNFSKIRGDIRKSRLTTGINDTGGKSSTIFASVVDTSGKFAASVVDTGGMATV